MKKHPGITAIRTILMVMMVAVSFTAPVSAATNLNPTMSAAQVGYSGYEFLPGKYYIQSDTKALLKIYADNSGYPMTRIEWKDPQDNTISCGAACATTYEYAPNNSVISSTSEFFIAGRSLPIGSYMAVISYCTNKIGSNCTAWSVIYNAGFHIAEDPQAPVIATVPVGGFARGVGVNPTTNRVYVANGDNHVSVIDGVNNSLIFTVTVGSHPNDIDVNQTTNRIYVSNGSTDSVSVINGASNAVIATVPVGSYPMGVGVNPTTNRIYVANEMVDTVSVIDGSSNSVIATVPVEIGPRSVSVNPMTNRVYVANEYSHSVSVIDGASNTVITTITVGAFPVSVRVNPNTNRAYVGSSDDNTVSVIDTTSNTVVTTVPMGATAWDLGVNPTTNHIFAVMNIFKISMIDGRNGTVTAEIPMVRPPGMVGVNPLTNRIYVTNYNGNSVTVIQDDGPVQLYIYLPAVIK